MSTHTATTSMSTHTATCSISTHTATYYIFYKYRARYVHSPEGTLLFSTSLIVNTYTHTHTQSSKQAPPAPRQATPPSAPPPPPAAAAPLEPTLSAADAPSLDTAYADAAATKVQASFRGFQARKEVAALKEQGKQVNWEPSGMHRICCLWHV
jgi:hypothetical protein